jgi:AmmeMemoRadiSam system protein A
LAELRATFVTLKKNGALRGCIGSLEARFPLATDVARNAYWAAFRDPRFRAVEESELDELQIEISLLTAPEPVFHGSEADLIRQLRPGVDGPILQEGSRRGTFLPSVWASLPVPEEFIRQLKIKAGFPPDHWSEAMEVFRYRTERLTDEEEWE